MIGQPLCIGVGGVQGIKTLCDGIAKGEKVLFSLYRQKKGSARDLQFFNTAHNRVREEYIDLLFSLMQGKLTVKAAEGIRNIRIYRRLAILKIPNMADQTAIFQNIKGKETPDRQCFFRMYL